MAEGVSDSKAKPVTWRWPLLSFVGLLALTLLSAVIAAFWLDSDSGHEYIVSQIEALEPEDGMRFELGSIEGSVYGDMQIIDPKLSDTEGVFFSAGKVGVNWNPLAWIFNELNITKAIVSKARLERFPKLLNTKEDKPLLPEFDIFVGNFRADNLALGPTIAGEEQYADLDGAIDVRSGRIMIDLDAGTTRSGDKLTINLNAEPDRDKLDLKADIVAPSGGAIANYLGVEREFSAVIDGEGDWQKWQGDLTITSAGQELASMSLDAREGLLEYTGNLVADMLPAGLAQKLGSPRLAFQGSANVEDGLANIDLSAGSRALTLTTKGGIDFANNALDALRFDVQLRDPSALLGNMKAQDFELKAILNGRFSELRYQYLLTAPQLAFGKTILGNVRAEGEGRRDAGGWDFPVELSASTLIGNGEIAKQLASGFRAKAFLRYEKDRLFADKAVFTTNSMAGIADVNIYPASGDYNIALNAQAPKFSIKGFGLADITAEVKLSPGTSGLGLAGDATARVVRLDNAFLRKLGGGLPVLKTGLALGPDRRLRFNKLSISAPLLSFSGSGVQKEAAAFAFSGSGTHDQYGRFDLTLDGPLARPQISLLLNSPLPAAGLSAVRVQLEPSKNGFSFRASGGSTLGSFDSDGMIVTISGQETLVRIDRLLVSQTLASGIIRPTDLGLAGNLKITGGGINGSVMFEPGAGRQLIRAKLRAKNARFDGNPPIFIRTGVLDADIILRQGRSNITATVRAQGISKGELMVGRIAGNAKLTNGSGTATFSVTGTRGNSFEFQARANIRPNHYVLTGRGLFEGRRLRLSRPLDLRYKNGGWTASPTTISYGSGTARVSGRWGTGTSKLNLKMSKMPLSLVDIFYDDLGLSGLANGTINLSQSGAQVPTGKAKLTIRGLTRSGLILTSTPVDLGLNIAISSRNAAARGIIKSKKGKTIGRFQGRVTGLGNGSWKNEIMRRPLFAQARFNGATDSLWRLTGIETFDLTGPVAVSADVGGTLANPQIKGQLRTTNARLESSLTGTVISGIKATGRFNGSRLVLPRFTGVTKGGGSVSGSGSFNLAVGPGESIGIVMDMTASKARLIARDDFSATVTGPIKIRSSSKGGTISGNVILNRSFFKFGRAAAAASLPRIKTREINRRADERPARVRSRPWRFALNATAPNRLKVEGLGLDSEWRADLKISGPVDNFAMTGSARLVRGNYTFAGRRFRLARGRIRFVGNQPINPVLDIEAQANLTGLNATINVAGSGNRPEIAFNSIPALPEDELLSRILFGASISDLSALEAVQLAAAVASLNSGGGLDPINQLRKAVGLDRLRILPSDVTTGQGTSIAAGKYITRRTYVELITDGKGYSATRLEFQITRWLSILSSISTLGRQSANIRVSKDY